MPSMRGGHFATAIHAERSEKYNPVSFTSLPVTLAFNGLNSRAILLLSTLPDAKQRPICRAIGCRGSVDMRGGTRSDPGLWVSVLFLGRIGSFLVLINSYVKRKVWILGHQRSHLGTSVPQMARL